MKKQFIVFITISVIICGCSKKQVEKPTVNASSLSQDNTFIEVVNQENQLTNFISNLAVSKGLTLIELKDKIQALHEKDLNSTFGDSLVNQFIGNSNSSFLNSFSNMYRSNWNKLNDKYSYISLQQIDTAVRQVYSQRYNMSLVNTGISDQTATNALIEVNKLNDCGWQYALCMAASTAVGITCHVSCIGGTAGLGTPACVLLCGTIEAAAGVGCINSYCPLP